jgi:hypothetical protein
MELTTTTAILWLIFSHWIADFICQDEKWALSKKDNIIMLLKHTITYSSVMILLFVFMLPLLSLLYFWIGLFITHTVIDYFTSKIVGKRFKDGYLGGSIPNLGAFSMIGLDQVLHYITIIFLLYFIV